MNVKSVKVYLSLLKTERILKNLSDLELYISLNMMSTTQPDRFLTEI